MGRKKPRDALAVSIGLRIAQLRRARGLTQEKLVYEFSIGSKSFISELERGLVHASMPMLQRIADALDVELFDLLVFPDAGERHELVDSTRALTASALRRLQADLVKRRR